MERQTKNIDLSQQGNRFNPLFIYNRVAESCATGSRITDALAFMSRVGALPFRDMWSTACPDDAGPDAEQRAAAYRIGPYRFVNKDVADDIKGELAHRRPVVFGIRDTTALHRVGAGDIYASPSSDERGYHAMVVVGYDDARYAFKVMNSWGRSWGEGGFGWINYDTFARETQAAFSAGPSPTLLPAPAPPIAVIPSPPAPPIPDAAAELRRGMQRLASNLSCARLAVTSAGQVTGFVGSDADLQRVRAAAAGASVQAVALRPWPQCEALLTLDGPLTRADGLAVTLDNPEHRCPGGTLCGGDALAMTVRMPRWSAYLYVAYIQSAGDTLLLEQPASEVARTHKPNEVVVLGRGDAQAEFRIASPFGREMVIVLASASPLFETKLPDGMTEREFLTVLRKALVYKPRVSDPNRIVAAAVLPITTSAR
jgi:hypothetical protein